MQPIHDGYSERMILILKDSFRSCLIDFSGSKEDHQPLLEFKYDNSYLAGIGMASLGALHGRTADD